MVVDKWLVVSWFLVSLLVWLIAALVIIVYVITHFLLSPESQPVFEADPNTRPQAAWMDRLRHVSSERLNLDLLFA